MDGIYLAALSVWSLMTLTWLVSVPLKNTSIVDIIYSLNFILIGSAYYLTSKPSISQTTILICTSLWALRLCLHLFIKNFGKGEDHRYVRFRNNYGKERFWWFSYFQVFLLQSLFVWVFATPIHLNALLPSTALNTTIYGMGIAIFIFGFFYEAVADYQLYQFKKHALPDQLLTKGLWRYSRHPNHFGEIILWIGISTICLSQLYPLGLLAYISPLAIALTFIYLSGSIQQEPRMSKRKRNFSDYIQTTPNIIPKIF